VVVTENLTRRFGEIVAVREVSFEVRRGEIFGILGPNGAGKSTTISILCTLLVPTAGTARVAGIDVVHDPAGVRQRIGLVFQDPSLDDQLTGRENLEFHAFIYSVPASERRARIDEMLALLQLSERAGSQVRTYSGGMKRRLEIARGLLHTPKVLFLDEPTLGLDPQSRNQMWTLVKSLNGAERVTVFLTTHYMDEADRVADRIAVIDHGRLVATGSSAELKQQTGTDSLEAAFLALTGTTIRDESATAADQMRQVVRVWRGR
jgi:ABC-2 type transport system ATP-binding protein